MTNALAVLQKSDIQLSELEQMILEEAATDTAAYTPIPTRIKISPGGVNNFVTSDGEMLRSFTAIVPISQMARAYWPEKGTGSAPLCSSPDGSRGYFDVNLSAERFRAAASAKSPHKAIELLSHNQPLPESFSCAACPMAQWGSVHQGSASGKGQACKSLRRLVVLVDGWAQPALLTLPPTSIKGWDTYCSSLARQKSAYFAVRTKIALEAQKSGNGDPYSVATFAMVEPIDDTEQMALIIEVRRQYKSLLGAMPIEGAEYEVSEEPGAAEPMTEDSLPF